MEEEDVKARLGTAIGANYDAGQRVQGTQGRDNSTGVPKTITRTDSIQIDSDASAKVRRIHIYI